MKSGQRGARGRRAGVLLVVFGITACGGGGTSPDGGGGGVTLTLSPTSGTLHNPGDTLRLTAAGSAASGAASWSTSNPSVLSVTGGLVTAVGYGQATVTVSAGGAEASASLAVVGETSLDFLEGAWSVEDEATPSGTVSDGAWIVVKDQAALRGVWRGTMAGTPVEVVYLVVRRNAGWALALADGVRGTFAVLDGAISPGRIAFDAGTRLGDAHGERVVLTDFTSSSFRWRVEESVDGGSTWTPRWIQRLTRSATRSAPPVLDVSSPACAAPEYAQFEFWHGDWRVRVPSGGVAGTDLVHRVAGCGLQENWRDASSGGGVSLNMYDPRSAAWTQFYVASNGSHLELVGHLQGGRMVLAGTSGNIVDQITWSLLDDGRVRQLWERGSTNGPSSTFFDGYYEPR